VVATPTPCRRRSKHRRSRLRSCVADGRAPVARYSLVSRPPAPTDEERCDEHYASAVGPKHRAVVRSALGSDINIRIHARMLGFFRPSLRDWRRIKTVRYGIAMMRCASAPIAQRIAYATIGEMSNIPTDGSRLRSGATSHSVSVNDQRIQREYGEILTHETITR